MKLNASAFALASLLFHPVNCAVESMTSLRGTRGKDTSSEIVLEYENKIPDVARFEDIKGALEHQRYLADGGDCAIFAEGEYWTLESGSCANLEGSWWNDRVTHIRGSDTTTVYAYENHLDENSGGQVTESTGSAWKALAGTNLYQQVSWVCCSSTGSSTGYILDLTTEIDVDANILENIHNTFDTFYAQIAQKYNPNAPREVNIIVEEFDWDGVPAYTTNDGIHLKYSNLIASPKSMANGVVVHEATHVVQSGWKNVPGHFIEGFADFVRDETGIDKAVGHSWSIPLGYQAGQQYTDGYGTTAAFIKWMIGAGFFSLDSLIAVFLDGSYSDDTTWPSLTGQSLDDLWVRYAYATVSN